MRETRAQEQHTPARAEPPCACVSRISQAAAAGDARLAQLLAAGAPDEAAARQRGVLVGRRRLESWLPQRDGSEQMLATETPAGAAAADDGASSSR